MAGIVTYDGSVMTAPPLSFYSTTEALVNETMTSGNDTLTYSNNTLDEAEIYRIYRPIIAWTDKYVTLLMYIIGFPGNALAFVVWIQRRMRHSSGCYLAALAFVDFVFLSLQLVFELHSVWGVPTLNVFLVCEIFPVFFIASQHLSPLLVLGFTFERFISVCYPFQRDRFCTTSRAIKVICALMGGCLALHAVQAYFWHYDAVRNDCSPRQSVTAGGALSVWSVWSWVTELIVFGVVPLVILALNACVIAETNRIRRRERKELCLRGVNSGVGNSGQKKKGGSKESRVKGGSESSSHGGGGGGGGSKVSATTFMLLAVSFYLIITTLPVTICYVLYLTFPAGAIDMDVEQVAMDATWQRYLNYVSVKTVVQEVGMSHYACNIIIYVATGRLFRLELRRLFTSRLLKQPLKRHHHYDNGNSGTRSVNSREHRYNDKAYLTADLLRSPSSNREQVSQC